MGGDVNRHVLVNEISRSARLPIVPPVNPLAGAITPPDSGFDQVLFWARLAASQSRKSPRRVQSESQALQTIGAKEGFLAEFLQWRTSEAFSAREKAAMELSESISHGASKKQVEQMLRNAARHFTTAEMIQLTLSIRAINDWYDTHSRSEAFVLIVQDDLAERDLVREHLVNSKVHCAPIFVQQTKEALDLLTGAGQHPFRSRLIALVVDVHLPHISAAPLLQAIRTLPGAESLPVVVMTSSPHPQDVEECERLKQITPGDNTVNVASFSEALVHITDQSRQTYSPALDPLLAPRVPTLNEVYERLRDHFHQKTPRP